LRVGVAMRADYRPLQAFAHAILKGTVSDTPCRKPHKKRRVKLLPEFGRVKAGTVVDAHIGPNCGVRVCSRQVRYDDIGSRCVPSELVKVEGCTTLGIVWFFLLTSTLIIRLVERGRMHYTRYCVVLSSHEHLDEQVQERLLISSSVPSEFANKRVPCQQICLAMPGRTGAHHIARARFYSILAD
jgi:hypothetical protein